MAKSRAEKSEKKLVSRKEFLVGSGGVIAVVTLAACGAKTSSTTPAPKTLALTTPALTPKYGGTLKYACSDTGPGGWPVEAFPPSLGAQLCFEGLLHMDNKGNIIPWLADSYTLADDLKSITFNLRKGVRFHDGSDFNAEVAKWNLDNAIAAKSFPRMASVDIIDDYAIRVNFTEWSNLIWESFCEESYCHMISLAAFQKNRSEERRVGKECS
jgi:ABC-type transport system substrate-binding protein